MSSSELFSKAGLVGAAGMPSMNRDNGGPGGPPTSEALSRVRRDAALDRAATHGRPASSHARLPVSDQAPSSHPPELELGASRANRSIMKRLVDVLGSVLGMIALGPFLVLVALMIRLDSPGPALFRQRRTGRGGKAFFIYKFRTMRVLEDGPDIVQASANDSRITPLGAFLRRSCIDELPQLLNVLKGEMTLIGPRPHALAHDEYYSALIPEYRSRFLVRPGMAGLAQVRGYRGATQTVELMAARIELDREYIANWSLAQDVRILFQAVTEGPFHPAAL
jgi:putative colanic acid biosynthesis UDP-glucose lipid carrier transferase